MVSRKGERSYATMNWQWPDQVAERDHAEQFSERFGDEFIDPAARPNWSDGPRTHRIDISLADRQRNGRCQNCAD
jgi:hypothetical protein